MFGLFVRPHPGCRFQAKPQPAPDFARPVNGPTEGGCASTYADFVREIGGIPTPHTIRVLEPLGFFSECLCADLPDHGYGMIADYLSCRGYVAIRSHDCRVITLIPSATGLEMWGRA